MKRKYIIVIEHDMETNKLKFSRRNKGFLAMELPTILHKVSTYVMNQIDGKEKPDKVTIDKNKKLDYVIVDKANTIIVKKLSSPDRGKG